MTTQKRKLTTWRRPHRSTKHGAALHSLGHIPISGTEGILKKIHPKPRDRNPRWSFQVLKTIACQSRRESERKSNCCRLINIAEEIRFFWSVMQYSFIIIQSLVSLSRVILLWEICSIMSFCFQTELMVVTSHSNPTLPPPTHIIFYHPNREPTLLRSRINKHCHKIYYNLNFGYISYRDSSDLMNGTFRPYLSIEWKKELCDD